MGNKMTVIVFSGDMDKAMAAFNLAIGGASMGLEVTMFFTFWGLNIIRKNSAPVAGKGWLQKMLNRLNRGGSQRLPLSRFHMLGLGKWALGQLMRQAKFPPVEELLSMAKGLGVKFVACTTSMGIMGLTKEDFLPDVDNFAGVATYLGDATQGQVNLFI
ncbi:MAG: hypothetical protein D9V47_02885 [Clostridia bacterium]|nr:MAG: hypothetical protein D9V47_02885 [Clostridia bacterium]